MAVSKIASLIINLTLVKEAKKLTYRERKRLPDSAFAIVYTDPKTGKKIRKYPIHDEAHAKNALARVSQFGTPEEREIVRKKVYERYPHLKKQREEKIGRKLTREDLRKKKLPKR